MTRRTFLGSAVATAACLASSRAAATRAGPETIDCHTHFYDPTRAQGVPWPGRSDPQLYRPVYPRDYKAVAAPHGVTGTVVVEASAWIEDNQWVLDLAKDEPLLVGFVGRLTPGDESFAAGLKRFARAPLFRGIRVSGGDVAKLTGLQPLRDLALLARHDLSLDVNGGVSSLPAVAAIGRAVPHLRMIIDHLSNVRIDGGPPPSDWLDGMDAAARLPNVFCKVSGLVEGSGRRDGKAPADVEFYRPVLDAVWDRFGVNRLIYGSNWPVSEVFAPFGTVHQIVDRYFNSRGQVAARRYFADNARAAYKWVKR